MAHHGVLLMHTHNPRTASRAILLLTSTTSDSPSRNRKSPVRARAIARLLTLQTIATLGIFIAGCKGGVPNPNNELSSGQLMLDLQNAVVQMREDNANFQAQIDSLHSTVAYQDTIIRQLAALSNVSVRPPSLSVP